MKVFVDEFHQALRSVAAHRRAVALPVLLLAAGLGLAIAMACVIDAVLLRALPYPNAERVVRVSELDGEGRTMDLAGPNVADLRGGVGTFTRTTHFGDGEATVGIPGQTLRSHVVWVGGAFFDVLGQPPLLGRTLDRRTGNAEAVIGHALWQGLLQGRTDVLGRGLRVDGSDYTIVGVMPKGFGFPGGSGVWVGVDDAMLGASRSAHNWQMLALLDDAGSLDRARLEAAAVAARLVQMHATDMDARGFDVVPLAAAIGAPVRGALLVLLAGVSFLLVIAVTNAINLQLSLAIRREREFAVRAALGAGRSRLLLQRFSENVVVLGVAWVFAMAVAVFAIDLLVGMAATSLPRTDEIGLDARVVVASFVLALAIACVLTATTTIASRRRAAIEVLRAGGRGHAVSRGALRARKLLLVGQTALTTVLLVGAALLGRSFLGLAAIDAGYRDDGAVAVQLTQPASEDREAAFANARRYEDIIARIAAIPGVSAVGGANRLPLTGGMNGGFWDAGVDRFEPSMPAPLGQAHLRVADAGYFEAIGIPLRRGRLIDEGDRAGAPPVVVISEAVAHAVWGSADPLGRRLQIGNLDSDMQPVTVVGVVGDVHERRLETEPLGTIYAALAQRPKAAAEFNLVVRSSLPLATLMPALRNELERSVAQIPYSLHPLSELRADALAQRRFNLVLLGVFAVAALVLATSGLYGLMAFSVGQRRGELAVRQALGAAPARIRRHVLGDGGRIALHGIVAGLLVAMAGSRLVSGLLHGVSSTDPLVFAAVSALLAAVLLAASAIPAWRAARVAPLEALRDD
ncbi:MAG: ABC transporter permease [Xanthomonadales bacterium]|nr:ABC transporter permease [Xanthomonadales bacterium]